MKTGIILLLTFVLVSCVPTAVELNQCVTTEPSGFWLGLWHGAIIWFTFIGSWFSDSVAIYDVNNNGFWYDLGYLIGLGSIVGGTSKVSRN